MDEQNYNENQNPQIISTSQAVNLTSSIASFSTLAALFFCFADQRSRAVRRFSIQSVGLGVAQVAVCMAAWILSLLLGWIPAVGVVLKGIFIAVAALGQIAALVLRVRMMFHAYRGEAHVLPYIGEFLRRFE